MEKKLNKKFLIFHLSVKNALQKFQAMLLIPSIWYSLYEESGEFETLQARCTLLQLYLWCKGTNVSHEIKMSVLI